MGLFQTEHFHSWSCLRGVPAAFKMNTVLSQSILILGSMRILASFLRSGECFQCQKTGTTIKSGSHCIFELKTRGNFSQNKHACTSNNATLPRISSLQNLKDVCAFLKHHFNKQTGFLFLGAYHDKSNQSIHRWEGTNEPLDFDRTYWVDEEPTEFSRCIELYFFGDDYCRLNDIGCWKRSWTFCQVSLRYSICQEDNGGCEDICVARDSHTRTCKCTSGIKVDETRCGNKTLETATVAITPRPPPPCPTGNLRIQDECFIPHFDRNYRSNSASSVCNASGGIPLHVTSDSLCHVCEAVVQNIGVPTILKGETRVWLNIEYRGLTAVWSTTGVSVYGSGVEMCNDNDQQNMKLGQRHTGIKYPFSLSVEIGRCCLGMEQPTTERHILCHKNQNENPNPCSINKGGCEDFCFSDSPNSVTCSCRPGYKPEGVRCVDIDECETDNGGCHNSCDNYEGGFECLCASGFSLDTVYETECHNVNGCSLWNGKCQQKCINLGNGQAECECFDGYATENGTSFCAPTGPRSNKNKNNSSDNSIPPVKPDTDASHGLVVGSSIAVLTFCLISILITLF